jgi:hypothetical protein
MMYQSKPNPFAIRKSIIVKALLFELNIIRISMLKTIERAPEWIQIIIIGLNLDERL